MEILVKLLFYFFNLNWKIMKAQKKGVWGFVHLQMTNNNNKNNKKSGFEWNVILYFFFSCADTFSFISS